MTAAPAPARQGHLCQCRCSPLLRTHSQLLLLLAVVLALSVLPTNAEGTTQDEAEASQEWRLVNDEFDWQLSEVNSSVQVVGKGVTDLDGSLYFAGVKSYSDGEEAGDQNMFVGKLSADNTVVWTREVNELAQTWRTKSEY